MLTPMAARISTSNTYEIATILPPEEIFSPQAAGSISLFVHQTTVGSAYQKYITVFGRGDDKRRRFSNVTYSGITPSMGFLLGRENSYARAVAHALRGRSLGIIEVHNQVRLFFHLAKTFANCPISLYLHDDPHNLKGAMTPKERWQILERADAIYCCSDFVRRRFLTGLEAGRHDHVHVVYPGIPPITPRPRKSPIILFAGRLVPEKGALELAQAALRLLPHFPNWQIVLAGADPAGGKNTTAYTRTLTATLQQLGKQAVFLGYQPYTKVLDLFARAAIAVVPSIRHEPFGRTAAEALTAGCALITSGHGGLAEITGDAGILVSPVTPEGLALALQGLLEDPETLRAIQQQCHERAPYFLLPTTQQQFDQIRYGLLSQAFGG